MMYEKSCGFVVFRKGESERQYLIIRAVNGEHGFPKGHMENGETEYETAVRELKEETNAEVQPVDGFRRKIAYHFPHRANVMKEVVYFLGEYTAGDIRCQPGEVNAAAFFSMEEALALLPFEEPKEILKAADAFLDEIRFEA